MREAPRKTRVPLSPWTSRRRRYVLSCFASWKWSADIVQPREHATPPPLSTNVRPVRYSLETSTPQAQNLKDVLNDSPRVRSSSTSSLGSM